MKKIILTIAMLSSVVLAMAQSRRISGTVLGADGDPASGAQVMVKGTNVGVTADDDGNFTIEVPDGKNFLTISAINSVPQDIRLTESKTSYTVNMEEKGGKKDLDGITVYAKKIDRRSYTGSLNTVSSQDIANRPVTSVAAALDGAAPGLLVTSGGGQPGNNPDIMLRGQGSLSASSAPLIVLDGAPYSGALTTINPLDIKEIVVLKDATAKAVYGARAANGVILITTKRGEKSEKPRINFDASVGFLNRFLKEYKRLGIKDYYELAARSAADELNIPMSSVTGNTLVGYLGNYNAYQVTSSNDEIFDPSTGKIILGDDKLRWNDDWQKELQRIGVRQNYNLSIQNANENSSYYLSVGYTRDQGIVKNSDYHRITGLMNVSSKVTNWLNSGLKMQVTYDDQLFFLGSGTAYSNPFFAARQMGSIYPVYRYDLTGNRLTNPDGTPMYDFGINNDVYTNNVPQVRPFGSYTNSVAALTYNKPYTIGVNGNVVGFLEAKIYRDLTAKTTISVNYSSSNELNYYNAVYGDASNVNGRSSRGNFTNINYTFNQFLTWTPKDDKLNLNRDDDSGHNFSLTVGHENYNWKNNSLTATRIGFPITDYPELGMAAAGEGSFSQEDMLRIETYFVQAEYNWRRRYYVSGSFSRNGSSRFSPEARWGNFGSAGVGWIISDEPFAKSLADKIDLLKLRFSWGVSGNDQINGYYSWMDRFATSPNANNPGLFFANYGNKALKWEGSVDMNLGVDLATKRNRLTTSLDLYNRGSNNLLYVQPLAPSVGSSGFYANVGAMRNRGIELSFSYRVLEGSTVRPKLTWMTKLNLAHNRNAITKMQDQDTIFGSGTLMTKGLAVGTFFLPQYAGVNSLGQPTWRSGDSVTSVYADLDPVKDSKIAGSSFRDIEGSWTNTFGYKNFDMNFTFTFGIGGKYYDQTYAGLVGGGASGYGEAMHADLLNSWVQAGDENNPNVLPRFTWGNGGQYNGALSDRFLLSNSYLRMRNINIGYNLPTKMLTRASIRSLRVYASADNVFNVSARQGVDLTSAFFGVSSFTYFPYRTVVFGVNLGL